MKICFKYHQQTFNPYSKPTPWFNYQHINITGRTQYKVKTSTQTLLMIIGEHLQYFSDAELELNCKIYYIQGFFISTTFYFDYLNYLIAYIVALEKGISYF